MHLRKKSISSSQKGVPITNPAKVRLAIECTQEERKFIKMKAAHEDKTINEFVLGCVWEKTQGCPHSHIPNEETATALDASHKGKGHRPHKSLDDMFNFLGI